MLSLDATAIAPFTTGLGNEHPLENGFAFFNPYGLPYLAGSGVKGVLRQAARELASGQWGNEHGWSADKQFEIRVNGKSLAISMLDALFGLESQDGGSLAVGAFGGLGESGDMKQFDGLLVVVLGLGEGLLGV